ncbi:hypothetical protein KIPB_016237, partial [Kipferlia bialata]
KGSNRPLSVFVTHDHAAYSLGTASAPADTIEGCVYLDLPVPIRSDQLCLKLIGRATSNIRKTDAVATSAGMAYVPTDVHDNHIYYK